VNDDAQLIDATLAGESAAFGTLVTRYQDRLYHALRHLMDSAEDARDVAQDAFVQAFVKLDSFHGRSAFYTWLYRIAFNQAMSHRRRRRPTTSVDQIKDTTGSEPIDLDGSPDRHLMEQENVAQVRAALARLSDEHRSVLVLRELDGQDYESIAEILELPIGTVRSRLHRARMQLRDELTEMLGQEIKETS
jgi:RNA polymerase sigma-70 factor (ECF subfamily)